MQWEKTLSRSFCQKTMLIRGIVRLRWCRQLVALRVVCSQKICSRCIRATVGWWASAVSRGNYKRTWASIEVARRACSMWLVKTYLNTWSMNLECIRFSASPRQKSKGASIQVRLSSLWCQRCQESLLWIWKMWDLTSWERKVRVASTSTRQIVLAERRMSQLASPVYLRSIASNLRTKMQPLMRSVKSCMSDSVKSSLRSNLRCVKTSAELEI